MADAENTQALIEAPGNDVALVSSENDGGYEIDAKTKQMLTSAFEQADKNNDGSISAVELMKSMLKKSNFMQYYVDFFVSWKHLTNLVWEDLMQVMDVKGETREDKKNDLMMKMSIVDTNNE